MTEQDLIKYLAQWIDRNKYPFEMPNCFIYAWECDYWCMTKNGETREFEVKCSRGDFFQDAKKAKHSLDTGANYFYYVVPAGLVSKNEVPEKYGLIAVHSTGFVEVAKKPKRLHSNLFTSWEMLANKMNYRYQALWREKYMEKKITHEEYKSGQILNLDPQD